MADNELVASIQDEIATCGWSVRCVFAEPGQYPYAYTVGLSRFALPEMIAFGIPDPQEAVDFLNRMSVRALQPTLTPNAVYPLVPGAIICDLFEDAFPTAVIKVDDSTEHLSIANLLFGEDGPVPAVQLVFPDDDMRWPWHEDSAVYDDIPILGPVPRHLRP